MSKKLTITEMKSLAEKRGGKCLSDAYINSWTKLKWQCASGHEWEAKPNDVKQGRWCRRCARTEIGISQRLTIEYMQEIAEERGGKCLSKSYTDCFSSLLWQCSEGHTWKAQPYSVQQGRWCKDCSSGLGERICREFFEQLFGKPFNKAFPTWLVNGKNNRMELDGYNQVLRIAFEHQGEQHYSLKTHYINNNKDLMSRQKDDAIKRKLCEERGVCLIEIPEVPARLPIHKLKAYIKSNCLINHIYLPDDFDTKEVTLFKVYTTPNSKKEMELLKKLAEKRGGKCLSDTYINNGTKLRWQCASGHEWEAVSNSVKKGRWCRRCADSALGKSRRLTTEDMRQIAKKRGGKCLSTEYINNHSKLKWQCAEGHIWEAAPHDVKQGKWCRKCAHLDLLTIEEMKQIAEKRGGKCLSDTYINNRTKLRWQCNTGHEWDATPRDVKRGTWCRKCYLNAG